jgi:hypothetical protein
MHHNNNIRLLVHEKSRIQRRRNFADELEYEGGLQGE